MYCSLTEWFLRALQIASCCMESNAFWKSITVTHMSVLHSPLFGAASFYVWNLFLDPAWSGHCSCRVWRTVCRHRILLDGQVENFMYRFCRFFVGSFELFRFDSFLETVNRNNQFLHGEILGCDCLVHRLPYFNHLHHSHNCCQVFLLCPSHLFFHRSYLSTDLQRMFANVSDVRDKICFLSCLDIRDRTFSFLLDLLPSLIPFLIFLLMFFTWAFSFLSIFFFSR